LSITALISACHTHEHSTQHSASEHPSEHPGQTHPKAESNPNVTLKDVAAYIESNVKDKSPDGVFHVTDKAANEELSLNARTGWDSIPLF
jgi:hypothetical protein